MKEEIEKTLEGLSDKEIEALLEDAKAVKDGKAEGKAEYDEALAKNREESNRRQLKEVAKAAEFMKNANMPIKLEDKDLGFGKGEYDVRSASRGTLRQLDYRFNCMEVNLLRDIAQSMVDIQRLLMLVLKHQGAGDIQEELTELLDEMGKKYGGKA